MNNTQITKLHVSIINIKLTTTHPKLQVAQQNSKSKTTVVYAEANNNLPSNALFLQLQSRFDLRFLTNLISTSQTYFYQPDPSDTPPQKEEGNVYSPCSSCPIDKKIVVTLTPLLKDLPLETWF